ncbi:hypothetical protein Lser_V15G03934 [Lactuca serriola]
MKIGGSGEGWWLEEAMNKMNEEDQYEGGLEKVGMELGKRKVKGMLLDRDYLVVTRINGIGGSGKTTLAREIYRDDEVRSYFNNEILFLNVQQLRQYIWGFLSRSKFNGSSDIAPQWPRNQYSHRNTMTPTLVVLDDVWLDQILHQLIFNIHGCKTLVVSHIKFPSIIL